MPGEIKPLRIDPVVSASGAAPPARPRTAAIALDDSMTEAARKVLWRNWKRAHAAEPGARRGTDSEDLHDLRVAVRRMRVALRLFRGDLDRDAVRPIRKSLRRTARALGAVRDLDVFHDKVRHYLDALPGDRRTELDPLLALWRAEHAGARARLVKWLDSRAFAHFKAELGEYLRRHDAKPDRRGESRRGGDRVRDAVPIVLLRGWTSVRGYDESVNTPGAPPDELHQLRIACKRLRYTLEFFVRLLGTPAERLIAQLTNVQDHLGNLQDAVVACGILRNVLASGDWTGGDGGAGRCAPAAVVPGIAAYLDARQREIQTLVLTFPAVWGPVRSTKFKQQLLALTADW